MSTRAKGTLETSAVAFLRELKAAMEDRPDVIPEGWFSVADLLATGKTTKQAIQRMVRAGKDSGQLEQCKFRRRVGKMIRPVPYYRKMKLITPEKRK